MKRNNPVLLELILVTLFFAVSAGITLRVMYAAHEMNAKSRAETLALLEMENLAEAEKSGLQAGESGSQYTVYYDASFHRSDAGENRIDVSIVRKRFGAGDLFDIELAAYRFGQRIGALKTAKYIAGAES